MAEPKKDEVIPAALSSPAKENLDVVAAFHEQEEAKITGWQLAIEKVSDFFGSPVYFAFAIVFMAAWIGVNSWGAAAGWKHGLLPGSRASSAQTRCC